MAEGRRLHVVNGDVVAEGLRRWSIPGTIVAWRDVLHEGPVPEGLPLEELSALRGDFLASRGWGSREEIHGSFAARDEDLRRWGRYDGVLLWFEHDLYDQLQILQILAFFAAESPRPETLEMICIDRHPEVVPFHGLGQLSSAQLLALEAEKRPVTDGQLEVAERAWQAFRSGDPSTLQALSGTQALPFLSAALKRHLEQFPSTEDGLGRTERQALEVLAEHGPATATELFRRQQALEPHPFLGDSTFWGYLEELAAPPNSLVSVEPSPTGGMEGARVGLTAAGEEVLAGRRDRVRWRGLDRWFGGFHTRGRSCPFRWDRGSSRLVEGRE